MVWKKWKRPDSCDSDSVELLTPRMTPIFNFHYVISGLTIPTTTKTPTSSLVKTSLKTKKRWSDITIFTRPRYKDLLSNLPQEVKADRYCIIVLNRIASYGSVGISDCS